MNDDVFVRFVDFPATINAVTTPNDDGTFNVYVNSALDESEKAAALEHELYHIRRDHFYSRLNVIECERSAVRHERFAFERA